MASASRAAAREIRASRAIFARSEQRVIMIHAAVSVAQLVEHRSVAPRVAGSNPVAHPKTPNRFNGLTRKAICWLVALLTLC